MRYILQFSIFCWLLPSVVSGQKGSITLEDCFRTAEENNIIIRQMQQSIVTRQQQYDAAKLSALPDVDIVGGYHYLGDPLHLNLQSVREGIVEGSSRQNANTAAQIYQEITGNELSPAVQDGIYEGSKKIINGIYPDYDPQLSKQQYFTAGLVLRMPIYLGGKLTAAREVAGSQLASGESNLELTKNTVAFAIVSQYLQILYLNSMLQKQAQLVEAYQKIEAYGASKVKNQLIPPYQQHWASVALSQANSSLKTFALEKENALLTLQHLLGEDDAELFQITDTLKKIDFPLMQTKENFWEQNPGYQTLQNNTAVAKASVKVARSLSLPNIFGIGGYNLLRNDLPVITPAWMMGVELQWNLFSSFQNGKHVKATESLVKESELLTLERRQNLQLRLKIALNKLRSFEDEASTLDVTRKEAANTTEMIRRRMENQLSSVQDVNGAMQIQLQTEKAYYTAILNYNLALAAYLDMSGIPKSITQYLK